MEKKFCCLEHRVFGQVYIFGVHGPESYDVYCVCDGRVRTLLSAAEYWDENPVRKTDDAPISDKQLQREFRAWVKSKKPQVKVADRPLVPSLDETRTAMPDDTEETARRMPLRDSEEAPTAYPIVERRRGTSPIACPVKLSYWEKRKN